jgi:hypothetical protein
MMNPTSTQAKVTARCRGLLVIWGAQFVTLAIFVALTRIVEIAARPGDDALRFQLFDVLGGAGLALSFVLKRILLRRAAATKRPDVATTAYVVAFALCELAAIFGLVNYFISGVPIVLLFVLAAVGLLLHFPRRVHIEAATPGDTTQTFNSTMGNTQ